MLAEAMTPLPATNRILHGDCLELMRSMPSDSVDLIVTSPPYNNWRNRRTQKDREEYWKRTNIVYDNFNDKQDDDDYERQQVAVINEMVRLLKPTGTICYNHKDRIFNFRVKSPLEWILKTGASYRQRITWDRCGMQAYNPVRFYRVEEDIYILGKQDGADFTWNRDAARHLSIWRIPPNRNIYGHNATFPEEIPRRCIEAFTNPGDIVLDPYNGTGTTTRVAHEMGRQYIGIDISERYNSIAESRIGEILPLEPKEAP
jgi:site-specific DNA-methyltransferase (adenine-specific)